MIMFYKDFSSAFLFASFIKWNFSKFLINKEGIPVQRYAPNVEPFVSIIYISSIQVIISFCCLLQDITSQ